MLGLHRNFIRICLNFSLKKKKDLSKLDNKWRWKQANLKECREDVILARSKKFIAKI
jgi:hypothetical protein